MRIKAYKDGRKHVVGDKKNAVGDNEVETVKMFNYNVQYREEIYIITIINSGEFVKMYRKAKWRKKI